MNEVEQEYLELLVELKEKEENRLEELSKWFIEYSELNKKADLIIERIRERKEKS